MSYPSTCSRPGEAHRPTFPDLARESPQIGVYVADRNPTVSVPYLVDHQRPEVYDQSPTEDDHLILFNRPQFQLLNSEHDDRLWRYDHHSNGAVVGTVTGVVTDGVLVLGHSAPFGGPNFVRPAETAERIAEVIDAALHVADTQGIDCISARCTPTFYSRSEETILFSLLNRGFVVDTAELNFHIDLSTIDHIDSYVSRLKPPARRALKHASALPFSFSEITPNDHAGWETGYNLLSANRRKKGRRLRLSLSYVQRLRDRFPGAVRMFLLLHDHNPCAAALTYKVTAGRDLVVYWGDGNHQLARSPMNIFVRHLVERAIAENVTSLDLGISSLDGVPDHGLIQFKRSVNAIEQTRLGLVRNRSTRVR